MARKQDSGWRDGLLNKFHDQAGVQSPAAGMKLPMVEYDRGVPVGIVSYLNRSEPLPSGDTVMNAYQAFSGLYQDPAGKELPFLTVRYDDSNWSFMALGHNEAGRLLIDAQGSSGWHSMTERQFVAMLYKMRRRRLPDLASRGIELADADWLIEFGETGELPPEPWPGQRMSARRRNYEPAGQSPMSFRNPCVDIDLAMPGQSGHLALVVDYKSRGAHVNLASTSLVALSSLYTADGSQVPALVVRYIPGRPGWTFQVHAMYPAGRQFLAFALGYIGSDESLVKVIAEEAWVELNQYEWLSVLTVASRS